MKTSLRMKLKSGCPVFLIILFGLWANIACAEAPFPGGTDYPNYTPLDSWSFFDTNDWRSDTGYAPLSFTNLFASNLGDGSSLVVDNPEGPAWLQIGVTNFDGTTNLTLDVGSVTFWYAPNWSSTGQGGNGPGEAGRLLEVGGYTPDSSFGLWSLYVDAPGQNLYFSAQTNDFSGNLGTYVTAPIAFATNYWHFIAFTYSTTNTALYLDGVLATNGPPITNYPGPLALANGFFLGSDSNGIYQAEGMLDEVCTYNVPLDAGTIADAYTYGAIGFYLNPLNFANFRADLASAGSSPATNSISPDAVTGAGEVQWVASADCVYGANAYQVWLTNVTAQAAGNGAMTVTFTVLGGQAGSGDAFDVFANSVLGFGPNSFNWAWLGQVSPCQTYQLTITGQPNTACFLILGTPLDSDGADLTDAYQALVSHTSGNPNSMDGILTGWEVLLGLNPNNSNLTDPSKRATYGYTPADWLNAVSGVKSGTVGLDNEGNVQSVSQ